MVQILTDQNVGRPISGRVVLDPCGGPGAAIAPGVWEVDLNLLEDSRTALGARGAFKSVSPLITIIGVTLSPENY